MGRDNKDSVFNNFSPCPTVHYEEFFQQEHGTLSSNLTTLIAYKFILLNIAHLFIINNQLNKNMLMDNKKLPILKNYEFITANGIPCNLGFGAYGSVQLGRCLKTGETVAIKRIGRKIALNEVDVHMKLNHPNIIRMLDHYFD